MGLEISSLIDYSIPMNNQDRIEAMQKVYDALLPEIEDILIQEWERQVAKEQYLMADGIREAMTVLGVENRPVKQYVEPGKR